MESQVLKNYALLYARLKNYPKEALMLKKRDSIEESILKNEEDQLTTQRTVQKRKLDSLQNKKKVYTSNIRKPYKNNSPKKIASLSILLIVITLTITVVFVVNKRKRGSIWRSRDQKDKTVNYKVQPDFLQLYTIG